MANPSTEPAKQARPRRVFGRVRTEAGGKTVMVILGKEEIVVRPLHARRSYRMPVGKLAMHVMANSTLQ